MFKCLTFNVHLNPLPVMQMYLQILWEKRLRIHVESWSGLIEIKVIRNSRDRDHGNKSSTNIRSYEKSA